MVYISTNLSLFNILISKGGIQDGEIKLKWAWERINNEFYVLLCITNTAMLNTCTCFNCYELSLALRVIMV